MLLSVLRRVLRSRLNLVNATSRYSKYFLKIPHLGLSFAILILVYVGGCTSSSSPTLPDGAPQEKGSVSQQLSEDERAMSQHPSPKNASSFSTVSEVAPNKALARGETVYQKHCSGCHGTLGDGQGEAGKNLSPRPQDFTKGVYKFRSSPSGELPTDDDLFRTITVGIPGTSMDSYRDLSENDRQGLIIYLKSLSPRFLTKKQGTAIMYPKVRPQTKETADRGLEIYQRMQCAACHGKEARGDGPLALELKDTSGQPIPPADLTSSRLKSGPAPEDIYRTIMTGLDGTPMPSYGDSLDPEEGWNLALYIFSLAHEKDSP